MFTVSSVTVALEVWLTMTAEFGYSIYYCCLLFERWSEDSSCFLPKLKAIADWLPLASPVDIYVNSDNNKGARS